MDAVRFVMTMRRIYQGSYCKDCVANFFCQKVVQDRTKEEAEKTVKIVEEWAESHPAKTRQSEFLKEFPNAAVAYGTIDILPCKFDKTLAEDCDGGHPRECVECKQAYWNKEVE